MNATRHRIQGNTYPVKERLRAMGCRWDAGEKCWWTDSDEIAAKAAAIVQPHPLYNSPPPKDLGTADPVTLAAKFGRTVVPGATVRSRNVYGLGKGDDGDPNGTIHRYRDKGANTYHWHVQVARTPRRYLSRDWLEDMDLFQAEPGGSYQWDGIEVMPTEQETAKAAADMEAREAPKQIALQMVALVDALAKADEWPGWCAADKIIAKWPDPVMPHTGSYPVLYRDGDQLCYYVPGYFACDWDHAAVIKIGSVPQNLDALLDDAKKHKLVS